MRGFYARARARTTFVRAGLEATVPRAPRILILSNCGCSERQSCLRNCDVCAQIRNIAKMKRLGSSEARCIALLSYKTTAGRDSTHCFHNQINHYKCQQRYLFRTHHVEHRFKKKKERKNESNT